MSLIYCINTVWRDVMQFCTSCTFAPADFHLYPPGNKQAWRPLAHNQCWRCNVVLRERRRLWWILSACLWSDSTLRFLGIFKNNLCGEFPSTVLFVAAQDWLLCSRMVCRGQLCLQSLKCVFHIHFCSLNFIICSWKLFLRMVPQRSVSWQRSEVPARY